MAFCEVILREDMPNLGEIGDVVRVRPGYARNYLFPRNLAVEANRKNLRQLEHAKRLIAHKIERDKKGAQAIASKLHGLPLIMTAKAGEGGRLFGSVTNIDLERRLGEIGYQIDRRRIFLETPLKELGTYAVEVDVGRGVRATLQITVEPEVDAE
jgi:large subunit ribosomal protein L9